MEFLIGVDGGGSGTRARLARPDGSAIAEGASGPSALAHGVSRSWDAIEAAIDDAFAAARLARPANGTLHVCCGLAGAHNREWAAQFLAADPGFAALLVQTDARTTLLGAHEGRPGAVVAVGTGSVGIAMMADGGFREVGGYGLPAGDEGSGAWIGVRAVNLAQRTLDGELPVDAFTQALAQICGRDREQHFSWLAQTNQTGFARLAPLVLAHAPTSAAARALAEEAGLHVARLAGALDPTALLPLAICGGLSEPLRDYLPSALRARCVAPLGDSAHGALRMLLHRAH